MNDSLRKICFAVVFCVLSAGIAMAQRAENAQEIIRSFTIIESDGAVFTETVEHPREVLMPTVSEKEINVVHSNVITESLTPDGSVVSETFTTEQPVKEKIKTVSYKEVKAESSESSSGSTGCNSSASLWVLLAAPLLSLKKKQ